MIENKYLFDNVEYIRNFILGGKATITLESIVTGKWFTYNIKKLKKEIDSPYFVSVLTGNDNERSYCYMGIIYYSNNELVFKLTKKSRITEDALSFKAFDFFFKLLSMNKIHSDMNIYHSGKCGICGRKLTTVESLKNGLGPECRSHKSNSTKSKLKYVR